MSNQEQAEQLTTGLKKTSDVGDISEVFTGEQRLVSHDGLSQYRRQSPSAGHSACGLAALNCARLTFEKQNNGTTGEDLIRWLSSRQGAEEITSICEFWTNPSHLDVEDILKVPYFSNFVNLAETYYEQCELAGFRTLLQKTQRASTLSAVIITKPPEIVACMKLPTPNGDVFLIFDSHIRSNHPNGAGFIFNSSIEGTADYLSRLFWVDDTSPTTEDDDSFGFQMDLLRQFCGHIIVPKPPLKDDRSALIQSLLQTSMENLALTTYLADAKATISSFKAELQRVNHRSIEPPNEVIRDWTQAKKQRNRYELNYAHFCQAIYDSILKCPGLRGSRKDNVASSSGEYRLQGPYYTVENADKPACSSNGRRKSANEKNSSASGFKTGKQVENDYEYAAQLQEYLKKEDRAGSYDKNEYWPLKDKGFSTGSPASSPCLSCSEKRSERDMVCIPRCRHQFCRQCLRDYVSSSLSQTHFPILCPMCAAENRSLPKSGSVDNKIIKQIGIAEEDYRAFQTLEANGPFVSIHCPRCQTGSWISRKEYREMKIPNCPSPVSPYPSCKECRQEVTLEPQHGCRVSSEVQRSHPKSFAQVVSKGATALARRQ